MDFVSRIEDAVAASEVLLAVVGRSWAAAAHPDGRRRLHDPADIVRLEVGAALRGHVPVIPVLVAGAEMPRPEELPNPLLPLARHNATRIDDDRFHHDVDRLLAALDQLLAAEPATGQPSVVRCQRCGAGNPAGARFCQACGAAEPAGGREVRTNVTVMAILATVAGEPGTALAPELLRQVLTGYRARTAEVIGRHGGMVVDAGDETVVAVFGVPRPHEEDAVRAVRAAAELATTRAPSSLTSKPPEASVSTYASGSSPGRWSSPTPAARRFRLASRSASPPGSPGRPRPARSCSGRPPSGSPAARSPSSRSCRPPMKRGATRPPTTASWPPARTPQGRPASAMVETGRAWYKS